MALHNVGDTMGAPIPTAYAQYGIQTPVVCLIFKHGMVSGVLLHVPPGSIEGTGQPPYALH